MSARIPGVLLLMLGCASWAGAQSPATSDSAPPATEKQAPAPVPAPGATPPGIQPEARIPAGTTVYLLIVEPVGKSEFNNLPYRTASEELFKKLAKEFEKQGRFRLMEHSDDADVVFFVLRFAKASYPHTLNYFALALTHDEYTKHVERLNGFRGIAHVEDMLPGALWGTGRDYNMAKHWTVGLATAGLINLGRPNPVDLVKQFHHDMQ